jgi:hypothetical protein
MIRDNLLPFPGQVGNIDAVGDNLLEDPERGAYEIQFPTSLS